METKTTRAQELLNRVYDHLKSIDISSMSMRDLQEFVEVLQKAHFLESAGQNSPYNFGGFGGFGGAFTNIQPKPATEQCSEEQNGD